MVPARQLGAMDAFADYAEGDFLGLPLRRCGEEDEPAEAMGRCVSGSGASPECWSCPASVVLLELVSGNALPLASVAFAVHGGRPAWRK